MSVIYTVGHSNHTLDAFLQVLRSATVRVVIDVRRFPASRRWPQFNRPRLAESLQEAGVDYLWIEELGGRREALPLEQSANPGIADPALRGYADWMRTTEFHGAVAEVRWEARERRVALMCAERSPLECHRRYLSDYLVRAGERVVHLDEGGPPASHVPTPGMILDEDGLPSYPLVGQLKLPF